MLEIVRTFEKSSGRNVPYDVYLRREGDVASCWADPTKARVELGWETRRDLGTMLADVWRWQQVNPDGYL